MLPWAFVLLRLYSSSSFQFVFWALNIIRSNCELRSAQGATRCYRNNSKVLSSSLLKLSTSLSPYSPYFSVILSRPTVEWRAGPTVFSLTQPGSVDLSRTEQSRPLPLCFDLHHWLVLVKLQHYGPVESTIFDLLCRIWSPLLQEFQQLCLCDFFCFLAVVW